jgi:hypothetical protein
MSLAIQNQSKVSNRLIKDILTYLKPFFNKRVFKKLEIHFFDDDSSSNKHHVSGISFCELPKSKDFKRIKKKSKYFIIIWVGKKMRFPFRWIYRKSAPPPTIRSLKEALLHTIAHEFVHCENWVFNRDIWAEEVQAEKIAHSILKEYRKSCYKKHRRKG